MVALIILLPLLGAAANGLLGLFVPSWRERKSLIGAIACLAVAVPFVLAVILFAGFSETQIVTLYQWAAAGDFTLDIAYRIDQLSLIMTLVVTGVGAVIHVYSIGYMGEDPDYWRYFSYMNLFIFAMLNLVLSDNLVGLFLGWEGVGLCSYLLIGFWYTDLAKSAAAMKAFIVNRIGDFAFLMAMFLLFKELGGLDFGTVLEAGPAMESSTVAWVILLMFFGATGKSAQIPLHVWLPDAMAGPTPVSALIHAATMVTSGLYLLARMSPVVLAAPDIMMVIAVIGALTAVMAATIAITQNDIKRVLAYSTISQLGYMFLAAGAGAFFVAIFHVMTHAFFKACLFLGSGSVIHAMHGVEHELEHREEVIPNSVRDRGDHGEEAHFDPQDMRNMGGLKKYMPSTYWTFLLSTLAIAGIPLFSGFFSKDEILFKTFEAGFLGEQPLYLVLWVVGLITALLTGFYMSRALILTFHGEERWPGHEKVKPHESPANMTIPLWILGVVSVIGGFVGLPAVIAHGELNWIHHYLAEPFGGPVFEAAFAGHVSVGIEWVLIGLGGLIAVAGVWFGWTRYAEHGLEFDARVRGALGGIYSVFAHKYYWDEFYDRYVVRVVVRLADKGFATFDREVIDGSVNGIADVVRAASARLRKTQTGVVQDYAAGIVLGVVIVIGLFVFLT